MSPSIHTFQAATLADALARVRAELGPDAAVLKTRHVGSPLLQLIGSRSVEVLASNEIEVPSRLGGHSPTIESGGPMETVDLTDYRQFARQNLQTRGRLEASLVERLAADGKHRHG